MLTTKRFWIICPIILLFVLIMPASTSASPGDMLNPLMKSQLQDISPTGTGTLQGTVTAGGSPLAGVTVKAGSTTTTTDGSGFYSMILAEGSYTVNATKHGYSTAQTNIIITLGMTTVQDFILTTVPATVVSGFVTDGSGKGGPLAAKITITSLGYSTTVYTGNGSYSINLYQQTKYTFTVSAIAIGYNQQIYDYTFGSAAVTRDFVMEVDPFTCTAPGYRKDYQYFQDFETNDGDFEISGTPWSYGSPIGGPTVAHSGEKVWATNLTGTYPNDFNGSIISPLIDLSSLSGSNIEIEWWQWADIIDANDHLYLFVSKDGGISYQQEYQVPVVIKDWRRWSLALDPSYAVANFRLKFSFISNSTIVGSGYYLDDLGIGGVPVLVELFEGANFPPPGWNVYDVDGVGKTWEASTYYQLSGFKSAYHGYVMDTYQDGWLVTPDILIGNDIALNFWETSGWQDYYKGHYGLLCDESSPGGCSNPPANYYQVMDFGNPYEKWRLRTVNIADLTGHTVRFAWRYTGKNADDWAIDSVSITLACEPISDAQLTYNPGSLSATIVLGAAPSSTILTINNGGENTASFTVNEYNLGFVSAIATQSVSIPAYDGEIEHSPASMEVLSEEISPDFTDSGRREQRYELADILSGVNAYAFDISDINHATLVNFNTSTPGTFNIVADRGTLDAYSGDFLIGDTPLLYILRPMSNNLLSINTTTGAPYIIGPSIPLANHHWSGLTSGMNGTLYASSTDCSTTSEIYTIDPSTGAATPLVGVTNAVCLSDIAMDANGEMYGVDVYQDRLIKFNLNNGHGTQIGWLGVDANGQQGLSFDQTTGTLYWAAYINGSGGQLRVIDTQTGASALLGAFPYNHQVVALAFPTNGGVSIPWLSEQPTSGGVSGNSSVPVEVTFTPPTQVYQLGTYTGQLKIGNDTQGGTGIVPVSMDVQMPNTWGWVQGTVTGLTECDGAADPLQNAYVEIRTMTDVFWGFAFTDVNGHYHYPAPSGSYKIKVSHYDYVDNLTSGFAIPSGGGTATLDISLRWNLPCLNPDHDNISVSLFTGNTTTKGLVIDNTGAGQGTALLLERSGLAAQTNLIQDPSFEMYLDPSSPWQQYSLRFDTPLCNLPGCSLQTHPLTGNTWAWFGGWSGDVEESYLKQTITIPAGTSSMVFWLATPACVNGAADYLVVRVDGVEIFRVDSTASTCGDDKYYPHIIDISAYADGAPHEIMFYSQTIGGGDSNFVIDDVAVESPGVSEVSWLSECPGYVTIPGVTSASFDVTFNAENLPPGSYNATLILENLPRPTFAIPVTMVVGGAPSSLEVTGIGATWASLQWADNSVNEDGFVVERSLNGIDNWSEVGTTGQNQTNFRDQGLNIGTAYYYRVYAYSGSNHSNYTNIALALTNSTYPTWLPNVIR